MFYMISIPFSKNNFQFLACTVNDLYDDTRVYGILTLYQMSYFCYMNIISFTYFHLTFMNVRPEICSSARKHFTSIPKE